MRRMLSAAALLLVTFNAIGSDGSACDPVDPAMRFTGPDISLEELEIVGRKLAASNPAAPQVPFALANENWLWLRAQYRAGDRIVAFEGPPGHDGQPFAWGYALLRGQCVVGLLTTRRA
ncbi:hypothetical protein [Lysobacter arvi]|uniref:Lipoprotein SmpA/OmlA domain-containing protein n=1 Tax=Lysobacter arvi TaxID=3038776 RepID=A0ABU1CDH0_9GAMM|nr:hypothetical protein [Lysobacter arvi]MDR0183229.1 hypothetical protein [Lysobacter arvi]